MQKLLSAAILSITLVIFFTAFAGAGEKATKEECIAKCKQASQLIKEVGLDDALAKISSKNSGFIWKNSYVFCFDNEVAKMLAHPSPKLIGFVSKDAKDSKGTYFMREMMDLANSKGEGWVRYMYVDWTSEDRTPKPKISYILKVPGEKVIVAAGIFE